ncbi:LysR family transcriptional regulator [Bowmanella sp. Y26]|uniref:LysR family transcriptional regulator n=1 Tax=Bowmanella yangjiangensis TaxID=2811230 RepID=UPI001BDCFA9E|nr:LysR family transcriptional regulator [Bowmanella yangjiangensis]MBT1062709.1 LysR family transcriptional regulator [Bowmanella yangjiangensis]
MSKISLEQWKMFVAVVEGGGFAQAGELLFKTQPAISHGVRKIEQLLGKSLFDIQGRKAVLTPFGATLLPQAKHLVSQANDLENQAMSFTQPARLISIAVDVLLPSDKWLGALNKVLERFPRTQVKVQHSSLSRAAELLEDGQVELAIASRLPGHILSHPLTDIKLVAVAASSHPLAKEASLNIEALTPYRQIVISDMGLRSNANSGWLGSDLRLSVQDIPSASAAIKSGLGFAWLPEWAITAPLAQGVMQKLALTDGASRHVSLQLGYYPNVKDDELLMTLRDALLST